MRLLPPSNPLTRMSDLRIRLLLVGGLFTVVIGLLIVDVIVDVSDGKAVGANKGDCVTQDAACEPLKPAPPSAANSKLTGMISVLTVVLELVLGSVPTKL